MPGLVAARVPLTEARLLDRMLSAVERRAQVVALVESAPDGGLRRRGGVIGVLDGPAGRYLVTRARLPDGTDWITGGPVRRRAGCGTGSPGCCPPPARPLTVGPGYLPSVRSRPATAPATPATTVIPASSTATTPSPPSSSPTPADSAPTASPVRATPEPTRFRVTSRAATAVSRTASTPLERGQRRGRRQQEVERVVRELRADPGEQHRTDGHLGRDGSDGHAPIVDVRAGAGIGDDPDPTRTRRARLTPRRGRSASPRSRCVRVGEPDQLADPGDRRRLHQHPAAGAQRGPLHGGDVGHGERALQTVHRLARHQVPALLQGSPQRRIAGLDVEEAGRAPRREPPVEDGAGRSAARPGRRTR